MPVIAARRPTSAWCYQESWERRPTTPDQFAPLPRGARFGLCVVGESLDTVFAAMSDETEGRRLSARDDAALRHTLQTLPPGRTWYLVSVVGSGDDGPDALALAIADVRRVAEAVIELCPAIAGWRILVRGAAPMGVMVSPVARAVAEAALVLRVALTLARHLVAAGFRRLALVARRGPSLENAAEEVDATIGTLNANLRAVDDLRSAGASVRVFAADLVDAGALDRVLGRVAQSIGPIGLVVHPTATPEDAIVGISRRNPTAGLFASRSATSARAMLASLAANDSTEAPLILFSSGNTPRGAAGQFEHAASRGYLDGLALAATTTRHPVLALSSHEVSATQSARLLLTLAAQGHAGALTLSRHEPDAGTTAPDMEPEARRRELVRDPIPPRTRREVRLAELWRDALRIDTVGVEDDFFALGGSSLLLTKVVARARRQLGVALPLAELLGAPTIANWLREPEAVFSVRTSVGHELDCAV